MKRALVLCALVAGAFYAAGAWSASEQTPTEKKLLKDVATLKSQVKVLQAQDKKQNTAIGDSLTAAGTAILLTGCATELTVDALQGTWQVDDQLAQASTLAKTFYGPQTPIIVSLGGQDLCQILSLTRSQVVPPSAATFQAFLGGFNGSSLKLADVGYRIAH